MDRQQLKATAKAQIKGHIGILFGIGLVIALICGAVSMVPGVGALANAFLMTPAFTFATTAIFLNLTRGQSPEFRDAFQGFNHFWIAFKTNFLVSIFVSLWSLLLVIPGMIKGLSYAMTPYIIVEEPEISAREAISRSKSMMHGHKMELFVLGLSFIGWNLLACCTLGILYIWLVPYMEATVMNFYLSLRGSAPRHAADPVDDIPTGDFDVVDEIPKEDY